MSLFFSNPLDPLVEKATNENIPVGSDDLVTCLDIVDLLKANKATPKHFTLAIKKRFTSKNPNVHLLTLALVDYCIKNAGSHVIIEIASRDFTDSLVALIQSSNNEAVLKKSLGLIQTWAMAFKGNQDLIYLCEAYDSLKREGKLFPKPEPNLINSILFETTLAPAWSDSDICTRCRTTFTTFNRKHHCRNCGKTFCQECSSKSLPLPNLGHTEPVRVCDTCHFKLTDKNESLKSTTKPISSSHQYAMNNSDEDLAKAIAESLELSKKTISKPKKPTSLEDEELERAIKESLEESRKQQSLYTPSKSSPSPNSPEISTYTTSPNPSQSNELTETQLKNLQLFSELVEKTDLQVQQQGFTQFNPFPLQTLFAQVSTLHQQLVQSLTEAAEEYRQLYDLNTEITTVIQDYDSLLQQRLMYSQNTRSFGFGAPAYGAATAFSVQPGFGVPGQPGYGQSVPGQPGYGQSVPGQPGYSLPGQSVPGQPGYGQPVVGQPGYGQPTPVPVQSVPGQPMNSPPNQFGQPGYGQPSPSVPGQQMNNPPGQLPGYGQSAQSAPGQPSYDMSGQSGYGHPGQPNHAPYGQPGQPTQAPGMQPEQYGQPGQYNQPGQPVYNPPQAYQLQPGNHSPEQASQPQPYTQQQPYTQTPNNPSQSYTTQAQPYNPNNPAHTQHQHQTNITPQTYPSQPQYVYTNAVDPVASIPPLQPQPAPVAPVVPQDAPLIEL